MFLPSVDEKSDEEQSYDSFKAYKCVWTEHFGHLFCITYMGVSGPSLLIESTDSMILRPPKLGHAIMYYNPSSPPSQQKRVYMY